MTALELVEIAGLLLCGTGGGVVGSILYFKPKLDKETSEAKIARIEAEDRRHDYLEERIEKMEKLYSAQGQTLDEVRQNYLELQTKYAAMQSELTKVQQENVSLRTELDAVKAENKSLNAKLESYKQSK